jgi:two-component system chemotaxis response regulator CheB
VEFAAAPASDQGAPLRVMLADDSAVVRGLITRMLSREKGIAVVASVSDGAQAVRQLQRDPNIDVVVLDVEMPVMDGLTALKQLLAISPTIQVIMASTLTQRNAEISLQAIAAGAADYIPKPSSERLGGSDAFRRELVAKVHTLGRRRRQLRSSSPASLSAPAPGRTDATAASRRAPFPPPAGGAKTVHPAPILRAPGCIRPEVIAIGSSTGGPQALTAVLRCLRRDAIAQPILITQHMPPTFTAILAEHLGRLSGWPCAEARDGERLLPRHIYVAPGDHHLLVHGPRDAATLRLTQDAPENFCRPAVDPMLRSLADVFGGRVLAVILTGMGSDGCAGARRLVAAGGTVFAQDEATSIVWGMPGAVVGAGLCAALLPLPAVAPAIIKFAGGGAW